MAILRRQSLLLQQCCKCSSSPYDVAPLLRKQDGTPQRLDLDRSYGTRDIQTGHSRQNSSTIPSSPSKAKLDHIGFDSCPVAPARHRCPQLLAAVSRIRLSPVSSRVCRFRTLPCFHSGNSQSEQVRSSLLSALPHGTTESRRPRQIP